MAESRWRLDRTGRYESIALEQLLGNHNETNPEEHVVGRISLRVKNILDLLCGYANGAERSYD